MTSHSMFCSFFFYHVFPSRAVLWFEEHVYTGGRAGKRRGEGRVYWKRRSTSLWERPEVEGHTNQPTALFRRPRPSRGTTVHVRPGPTPLCVYLVCKHAHVCVYVHERGPNCSGFHLRLLPPPSLNRVNLARRDCDWPSLRGGRVSPAAFHPTPDPGVTAADFSPSALQLSARHKCSRESQLAELASR